MNLRDKTKRIISKEIGIPYEQLIKMDEGEPEKLIEQKSGRKLSWQEGIKVDGLPIMTMKEVDRKINSWKKDNRER